MADKFGFGSIGSIVKQDGRLAGMLADEFGPALHAPALVSEANANVTMGEIVAIVGEVAGSGYKVRSLASGDSTPVMGVVRRDIVGGTVYDAEQINQAKRNVPLSIFPLTTDQNGKIVVAYADTTAPTVGNPVYVGIGTNGTIAGACYAGSGSGKIAVANFVYTEEWHTPTVTSAKAVAIGRKLY